MAGGRSQAHRQEHQGIDSSGRRKPFMQTVPTRAGTNAVGQQQTGTNGTFGGSGTVTITREWWRNGAIIAGQTGATYTLVAGDSGKQIRFANLAKSQYGEVRSFAVPITVP